MEIEIDMTKNLRENISALYERSKKLRKKAEGARKAMKETERWMDEEREKERKERRKMPKRREWYEKFRWFFTSEGKLCIGGKDARQNDVLVSRYMERRDLFLHADVHGAPVVVMKNGGNSSEKERGEAAQFAASYSSAWKAGDASVDVYAVKPEQVSKHAQGEYVRKGAFVIRGRREWMKNTPLGLIIGATARGVECTPLSCGAERFSVAFELRVGDVERGEAARKMYKVFMDEAPETARFSFDDVLKLIPSGRCSLKRVK